MPLFVNPFLSAALRLQLNKIRQTGFYTTPLRGLEIAAPGKAGLAMTVWGFLP